MGRYDLIPKRYKVITGLNWIWVGYGLFEDDILAGILGACGPSVL